MLAHDYATALKPLVTEHDTDRVFKDLERVLSDRGHEKLKKRIMKELLSVLTQEQEADEAVLTVANETHAKKYETSIADASTQIGITSAPRVEVDPTITGGFILRSQDKIIDMSYKRTLIELYRNITNHANR